MKPRKTERPRPPLKFDCYICDMTRETHALRSHEHQLGPMCSTCIVNLAIDAFFGGVAAVHGRMPSPLPLCEEHAVAIENKLAAIGLTMNREIIRPERDAFTGWREKDLVRLPKLDDKTKRRGRIYRVMKVYQAPWWTEGPMPLCNVQPVAEKDGSLLRDTRLHRNINHEHLVRVTREELIAAGLDLTAALVGPMADEPDTK
jgi:hypothetical protein